MLLHRSEKTLRNWRTDLVGPRYRKRGGMRYAIEDLVAWNTECPDAHL